MLGTRTKIFMFVTIVAAINGYKHDGLRAKFGVSGDLADVEAFFRIPRTEVDAWAQGWRYTRRPWGPFPQLRMFCYPGNLVCALFTPYGIIAGVQVGAPVEAIDPSLKHRSYMTKWCPPAARGEPRRCYWTATQYYVSEESLQAGGPRAWNGRTLQAGGVWVYDLNRRLMRIPIHEHELQKTPYVKQLCIANMGMHYFYNASTHFDCSTFFLPWFPLIRGGLLLGLGFQTDGILPPLPNNVRNWFEYVPHERTMLSLRDASECILDNHMRFGTLALHIYFIDKPWEIECEAGEPTIKIPSSYRS